MNNIANVQLFELLVLFVSAIAYIIAHFACSGLAIMISGQKSGLIRGFVQGALLVCILAIAVICCFNGKLKFYHFMVYGGLVVLFIKLIKVIKSKTCQAKLEKKNSQQSLDKTK